MPPIRVSDCRASGAARNEDWPDPCEVKLNKGKKGETNHVLHELR